jgi:hypothetical protein
MSMFQRDLISILHSLLNNMYVIFGHTTEEKVHLLRSMPAVVHPTNIELGIFNLFPNVK